MIAELEVIIADSVAKTVPLQRLIWGNGGSEAIALSLSHHVHRLNSFQRALRRVEGSTLQMFPPGRRSTVCPVRCVGLKCLDF